jgi:hypothetical protein
MLAAVGGVQQPGALLSDGSGWATQVIGNQNVDSCLEAMSVSAECGFIGEEGQSVERAFVQDCESRALAVAESNDTGAITVLDAATGDRLFESPPYVN